MTSHNSFRMVVLADELLESFFETDLSATFRLDREAAVPVPEAPSGLLGGIISTILTDENKKLFNRFADEIGKTMGKHHIDHRPSIGKVIRDVSIAEPASRESLLPRTGSSSSGSIATVPETQPSSDDRLVTPTAALSIGSGPAPPASLIPVPIIMERKTFAIDESNNEGEEDMYAIGGGDDDDEMMDEVDAFLEANDKGLTEAQNAEAKVLLTASPLK